MGLDQDRIKLLIERVFESNISLHWDGCTILSDLKFGNPFTWGHDYLDFVTTPEDAVKVVEDEIDYVWSDSWVLDTEETSLVNRVQPWSDGVLWDEDLDCLTISLDKWDLAELVIFTYELLLRVKEASLEGKGNRIVQDDGASSHHWIV